MLSRLLKLSACSMKGLWVPEASSWQLQGTCQAHNHQHCVQGGGC